MFKMHLVHFHFKTDFYKLVFLEAKHGLEIQLQTGI